ncbi:unnamed protein product [Linum tenue]|uniref:Uncharacterized protein n=1 Tax=Linum tenue TaxID=586396 RepID=A0AAV0MDU4_9ROSI|nr:unnamed protein product [Linum tenue]
MATAVLSPQDCLRDTFTNRGGLHSMTPRTKIRCNPTNTPTASSFKHGRGKSDNRRPESFLSPQPSAAKVLAMGEVKILKRGEPIQNNKENSPAVRSASAAVKVELKLDLVVSPPASPTVNRSVAGFYAGSGFFTSPPPSSLPLPVFLKKSAVVGVGVDSEATSDLRRLLNLAL